MRENHPRHGLFSVRIFVLIRNFGVAEVVPSDGAGLVVSTPVITNLLDPLGSTILSCTVADLVTPRKVLSRAHSTASPFLSPSASSPSLYASAPNTQDHLGGPYGHPSFISRLSFSPSLSREEENPTFQLNHQ